LPPLRTTSDTFLKITHQPRENKALKGLLGKQKACIFAIRFFGIYSKESLQEK